MGLETTVETVRTAKGEQAAVVTLHGMMTLGTNLKTADQKVQTALAGGSKHLVLDLAGVAYSDSAGLGMLVHTYGLVKARGGHLRLCGVGPRVAQMLQLTTTDRFLTVDADRAASLAALDS